MDRIPRLTVLFGICIATTVAGCGGPVNDLSIRLQLPSRASFSASSTAQVNVHAGGGCVYEWGSQETVSASSSFIGVSIPPEYSSKEVTVEVTVDLDGDSGTDNDIYSGILFAVPDQSRAMGMSLQHVIGAFTTTHALIGC